MPTQSKGRSIFRLEVTMGRWRYFGLMVKDMGLLIGRYLLVAIVIEAAIVAFVPVEWVRGLVGTGGPLSVLLAALAGVPIPLPQVAAVPVLHGLASQGMDPGAAMAFLVSGPVTSIPALVLLFSVFQRSVLGLYLDRRGHRLRFGFRLPDNHRSAIRYIR